MPKRRCHFLPCSSKKFVPKLTFYQNDTNRVSLPTLVSKAGDPICNTKIAIWNMNGNGFKSGPITAEVDDTCGTCQHDNSNNQNSIDLSMAAFGSLTGLPKDNYAKLHNQGVIKVCW
ncbi:MAG: hypothetical protein M1833_002490 [Piccolia ochrophora]|nr:MAG: hypothetical protein M1833_002490 [Piccolia ochrophora]